MWGPSQALERSCDRNGIRIGSIQTVIELCRIIGLAVLIQEKMETGAEVVANECVEWVLTAAPLHSRRNIHDLYY